MATTARGTFSVTMQPQPAGEPPEEESIGRMTLDKQFQGDLSGTSRGQMLAAQGGVAGSAGYVALERVRGTLHGRSGSFALQHSGLMNRGAPQLSITVVPDSGTEELTGIAGTFILTIADGEHQYALEYTLPE